MKRTMLFECLESRDMLSACCPVDVVPDGWLTPADVLPIVQQLNGMQQNVTVPVTIVDVNRDGRVTPLDALVVIDVLNRLGPGSQAPQTCMAVGKLSHGSGPVIDGRLVDLVIDRAISPSAIEILIEGEASNVHAVDQFGGKWSPQWSQAFNGRTYYRDWTLEAAFQPNRMDGYVLTFFGETTGQARVSTVDVFSWSITEYGEWLY